MAKEAVLGVSGERCEGLLSGRREGVVLAGVREFDGVRLSEPRPSELHKAFSVIMILIADAAKGSIH